MDEEDRGTVGKGEANDGDLQNDESLFFLMWALLFDAEEILSIGESAFLFNSFVRSGLRSRWGRLPSTEAPSGDADVNDLLLTFDISLSCRYFERSVKDDLVAPIPVFLLTRMFSLWLIPIEEDDDDEAKGGIKDGITKGLLLLLLGGDIFDEDTSVKSLCHCI